MSDVSAYASSDGESRAARAYGLYATTEMTWTLVAEVLGYASGASACVSARNHARNNRLKWPLRGTGDAHTSKGKLSPDEIVARVRAGGSLRSVAKEAGLSHQRVGQIWKKVTGEPLRYRNRKVRRCFYCGREYLTTKSDSRQSCGAPECASAAISDGVMATDRSLKAKRKQAEAYDAYATGKYTWREVMEIVGAKYVADARQLARVHAARNGLAWPLPRRG